MKLVNIGPAYFTSELPLSTRAYFVLPFLLKEGFVVRPHRCRPVLPDILGQVRRYWCHGFSELE